MSKTIQTLDTVALRDDLPALGLSAGEIGAVVEVHSPDTFEVEFVDQAGQTYGQHALRRDQVVPLHHKGQALRHRPEAG